MKYVLAALGAVAALAFVALAAPAADAKKPPTRATAHPVQSHRLKAHNRVVKISPHDSRSTYIVVPGPLPETQIDSSTFDDCYLTGNNCIPGEACQFWLENCDQVDQPAMSAPTDAPAADGSDSSGE